MYTSAAVLNSCNAGASSRSRADDREYYYDLFYSLLEEGGRRNPRLVLAGGDAAAGGGGGREAEPAGCCPLSRAWKIAIRSFIVVAWLLASAFLVSLLPMCKSGSEAFAWLASLVMVAMMAAMIWLLTLDCFIDSL
ncbi:uncharacterized protein LOC110432575 [Sorghum bicolor]|uniref:Uncharacterized protein n=1 Tax=Sorghum bicolor TaxID=4558 RepID=A0A1B6Q983_SORBI|nr:uncharacterized protein LOC110432575 [Sorghum bicolor]KXG34482.1 hypothetical protein SORBI_3002G047900 [Sorghum bicolor]|eukprot:XP_021308991.1 uncharacterized protein LOC110432575 [Sorghum bicolor]